MTLVQLYYTTMHIITKFILYPIVQTNDILGIDGHIINSVHWCT